MACFQEACNPDVTIFPITHEVRGTVFNSIRGSMTGSQIIRGLGIQRLNHVREMFSKGCSEKIRLDMGLKDV